VVTWKLVLMIYNCVRHANRLPERVFSGVVRYDVKPTALVIVERPDSHFDRETILLQQVKEMLRGFEFSD
jgi:hypothetical protein